MAHDTSLTLSGYTLVDARTREEVDRARSSIFRHASRLSMTGMDGGAWLRVAAVDLDSVRLASVQSGGHRVELLEPHGVTVLRPIHGHISVNRGQRQAAIDQGRSLVLGTGERSTVVSPGYHGLVVVVASARLEQTLSLLTQDRSAAATDAVLDWSAPASGHLDHYLVDLVRRPGRSRQGQSAPLARAAAEHALLALLAGAVLESRDRGAVQRDRAAAPWQVRRAEELLSARAREPITIADVCRELKVGARSLQLAFQRHRGTTAKQFLQACRLELAGQHLLDEGHRFSVTAIAHECGFGHGGRFARSYRERFGEWPSATRERARS